MNDGNVVEGVSVRLHRVVQRRFRMCQTARPVLSPTLSDSISSIQRRSVF